MIEARKLLIKEKKTTESTSGTGTTTRSNNVTDTYNEISDNNISSK